MTDKTFIKRLAIATSFTEPHIADICQKQIDGVDGSEIQLDLDSLPRYSFATLPVHELIPHRKVQVVYDSLNNEFLFRQNIDMSFKQAKDFEYKDFETLNGFLKE